MELAWTWWATAPVVIWLLSWSVAWFVYRTAPRRTVNRLLAGVLLFEGVYFGLGSALGQVLLDPVDAVALYVTMNAFLPPLAALYLMFLGYAVDAPMTRALRSRTFAWIALSIALAWSAIVVLFPALSAAGAEPDPFSTGHWVTVSAGTFDFLTAFTWLFAAGYALVASVLALRRSAPGSLARRRMRAFVVAFGMRDAYYIALVGVVLLMFGFQPPSWTTLGPGARRTWLTVIVGANVVFAGYVVLLAYGILRAQLLDIDVKLRWTVRQSTIAAVFAAVFVAVAAAVEQWAGSMGVLWGGLAAAALVFGLHPIQRFASRVAERAVPARPVAGLPASERAEVYADQLRAAWADGTVDRSERLLLENLRQRLAISADDAARLEREVLERTATS
ncbi:MAG TPA: hypothetical protein VI997_07320 [Candidatus Thermoplasmatota archaeon]|nr:hypothetical protein [Candidatus Thermoplasmatota archaeon]